MRERPLSENKTKLDDFAYKLPPTPRVGLVCLMPSAVADRRYSRHRPALILLFAKKFFRPAFAGRMRWTGQIFWLLASSFFPPSPPNFSRDWPNRKSYPVTAAQLLPILTGFLAPVHFFKLAKNWDRGLAACASSVKVFFASIWSAPPQISGQVQQWSPRPPRFVPARRRLEGWRRVSPRQ
jgi:hypothetical protein